MRYFDRSRTGRQKTRGKYLQALILAANRHGATSENLRFRTLENLSKPANFAAASTCSAFFVREKLAEYGRNWQCFGANTAKAARTFQLQMQVEAGALLWHKCRHNDYVTNIVSHARNVIKSYHFGALENLSKLYFFGAASTCSALFARVIMLVYFLKVPLS